jgi:hypothetical protein
LPTRGPCRLTPQDHRSGLTSQGRLRFLGTLGTSCVSRIFPIHRLVSLSLHGFIRLGTSPGRVTGERLHHLGLGAHRDPTVGHLCR